MMTPRRLLLPWNVKPEESELQLPWEAAPAAPAVINTADFSPQNSAKCILQFILVVLTFFVAQCGGLWYMSILQMERWRLE